MALGADQEVSIIINAVDNFSSTFKKAGIGMREVSTGMIAVGAAGAAVGAGLLVAAKAASKVETGFAKVNTLLDEGQDATELFGEKVKELNVLMGNQGDQLKALDGLYQTISAGISDAADAQFFMEKATIAAVGGSAQLDRVIEAGTKTIAAFGLEVSDTEKVFDIFAGTVKAGQTTMEQLATAFPTVAGTAGEMGVTLEETTGIFAGLTKVMAGPEEAAVALNAVLTGLIKPSDEMKNSLQSLGYESGQAAIENLGLMGALQALKGTTDGSAESMGELFGNVRAMRAVFPLLGGAAGEVASSLDIISNSTGLSKKQFEDMAQTTEYQWGVAMSEAQNTMIEIGKIMKEILLPVIVKLTALLQGISSWWNNLSETQKKAIVTIVSVTSVLLVVIGVVGILIKLFLVILPLIKLVGIAIGLLFSPIGLIIGGIAALIVAGSLLVKHWEFIKSFFGTLWDGIKNIFRGAINSLISHVEGMINFVIAGLNFFVKGINSVIRLINKVPGIKLSMVPEIPKVNVPKLAEGGIITSPTTALIGESGPEAVVPLKKNMGTTYNIYIEGDNYGVDGEQIAEVLAKELKQTVRI